MSSIRLSGTSSGYYDLTVPAVAGTNSIDLSNLPSKTNLGTSSITHGSNTGDTRFTLNSANQYTLRIQNAGNIAGQIGGGGADDLRFSNAAGATTMQIKDGHVLTPSQPRFYALNLNFPSNTGGFGTGGSVDINVSSSYNSSNGRFTAPTTGCYMLMMMTQYYDGSNGSYVTCKFYKNGSHMGVESYQGYGSASHAQVYLNTMAQLTAGDYVQAFTDFGARDIQNYFQAYLIA